MVSFLKKGVKKPSRTSHLKMKKSQIKKPLMILRVNVERCINISQDYIDIKGFVNLLKIMNIKICLQL